MDISRNKKLRENLLNGFLFLTIFSLIYFPVYVVNYLHHDDIWYFFHPGMAVANQHFFHNINIAIGRPLAAVFADLINPHVHSINNLKIIRFIFLISISIVSQLLFRLTSQGGVNRSTAFMSSILVFSLPPFQILASYAGIAFLSPAILFAVISVYFLNPNLSDRSGPLRISKVQFTLTTTFFLLSLCVYPSLAMIYWPIIAGIYFIQENRGHPEAHKRFLNGIQVGTVALVLYFLMLKINSYFNASYTFGLYDPNVISTDITGKLSWFVREPLYNALSLWSIFPQKKYAFFVGVLIASGALIKFIRLFSHPPLEKQPFVLKIATYVSIFIFFPLLSFLPNLAAKGDAAFYRCSAGLDTMVLVLFLFGGEAWLSIVCHQNRKLKSSITFWILLSLSVLGGMQAYNNVFNYRVKPSSQELMYIRKSLDHALKDGGPYRSILVIQSDPEGLNARYDEFNILTTNYKMDVPVLVDLLYKNFKGDAKMSLPTTYNIIPAGDPLPKDLTETLVIDMRQMVNSH